MTRPPWVDAAMGSLGEREQLGPNDSPWIRAMWDKFKGRWLLGQPWCGGAMAFWMESCGISHPKAFYRARAWLDWGTPIAAPVVGAVVVFDRPGGAHVGIVVGKDVRGNLMVIGGNQGDSVSVAPFSTLRLVGYRWPSEALSSYAHGPLPVFSSRDPVSTNEA